MNDDNGWGSHFALRFAGEVLRVFSFGAHDGLPPSRPVGWLVKACFVALVAGASSQALWPIGALLLVAVAAGRSPRGVRAVFAGATACASVAAVTLSALSAVGREFDAQASVTWWSVAVLAFVATEMPSGSTRPELGGRQVGAVRAAVFVVLLAAITASVAVAVRPAPGDERRAEEVARVATTLAGGALSGWMLWSGRGERPLPVAQSLAIDAPYRAAGAVATKAAVDARRGVRTGLLAAALVASTLTAVPTVVDATLRRWSLDAPPDATLSLRRQGCEGTCPVYRVELGVDGTVRWEGYAFVGSPGYLAREIDASLVRNLYRDAVAAGALDFPTAFDRDDTSATASIVTIASRGAKKRITHPSRNCASGELSRAEAELCRIERAIDELAGVDAWIGSGDGWINSDDRTLIGPQAIRILHIDGALPTIESTDADAVPVVTDRFERLLLTGLFQQPAIAERIGAGRPWDDGGTATCVVRYVTNTTPAAPLVDAATWNAAVSRCDVVDRPVAP